MNGAESLVHALIDAGIEVCFANPGTSEMHFVAALDRTPGIRCVLGLFEGVVTGAADGYARMADRPAVTLLHLGPGFANGIANLHNARKACVPVVNIVGEHAQRHIELDAPLTADIQGLAGPVSHWVHTAGSATELDRAGREAVVQARRAPGRIATLILPADTAWDEAAPSPPTEPVATTTAAIGPSPVGADRIDAIAEVLHGDAPAVLILGGAALRPEALERAGRIAATSGATLLCETFKTRMARGAGRVSVEAVPYGVPAALARLAPFAHVVTVGAQAPVAFFAYPDQPGELCPPTAERHCLAAIDEDVAAALQALEARLQASGADPGLQVADPPERCADGALTPATLANVVARLLPENAIVVEEAITLAPALFAATRGSPAHDWLQLRGGAIGDGLPLATGAAIACPGRRVLCLEGDGSAMYTLQALWTQAREGLDVTTLILANRSYAILHHEMDNVQARSGPVAQGMMTLDRPALDWVALAQGMGVPAARADSVAALERHLRAALDTRGPFLIEAVL